MQQLVAEFSARAATAPDAIAVIDASGSHTTAEVMREAELLSRVLAAAVEGAPTVLVQADNTWRTLAAALAVGMQGGLIAVISRHATPASSRSRCRTSIPDVVVASEPDDPRLGRPRGPLLREIRGARGWTGGGAPRRRPRRERWRGGVVIGMTSGSTGRPKCVVQSEAALRYAGRHHRRRRPAPGDPVAAIVPLSSDGRVLLRHVPAAAARLADRLPGRLGPGGRGARCWPSTACAGRCCVPTMALQLSAGRDSDGSALVAAAP